MLACKIDNFLDVMIRKTQKFLIVSKKKFRVSDTLERSLFHSHAEKLMVCKQQVHPRVEKCSTNYH